MDTTNVPEQGTPSRASHRRKRRILLLGIVVALAIALPVVWLLDGERPRFRTSALIVIESRPAGVALFQEFSPYRPLAIQLAILRSRSLAEAVIEALPRASVEDLIDNPYGPDPTQELHNWVRRLRGEEIEIESPQRRAVRELQSSRVAFYPQGQSGIVQVVAEASRPRVALDIAHTYIEVFLARTRSANIHDTTVLREFLERQLTQVTQSLQISEGAVRDANRRLQGMLADNVAAIRMREQGEMKVVRVIDPPHLPSPVRGDQQRAGAEMAPRTEARAHARTKELRPVLQRALRMLDE